MAAGLEVDQTVEPEEWQRVADGCPYATFFHTPAWHQAFAETFPAMRIATVRFSFDAGHSAIFPLLARSTAFGLDRLFLSTAAGCYGGWISTDDLSPEEISAMADWILDHCPNLAWRLNPLQPAPRLRDLHQLEIDTTEILHLREFDDVESIKRHYQYSVRKQINKAGRAGLTVRAAESWPEWEEYFRVYEIVLRKWGRGATSRYPLELFRRLFESRHRGIRLWVVASEGRIAGGNLNLYHNRHCVEWHAAYDPEHLRHGIRNYLVHAVITDAFNNGYAYYDFNPSGGHEGTRRFKQSFGTTNEPSNVIIKRRRVYRAGVVQRIKRMVVQGRG